VETLNKKTPVLKSPHRKQGDFPFLATKVSIPLLRSSLVPRPRLIQCLKAGIERKLVLVSAPAGFGKTTLLSDWAHQSNMPVTWFSIDSSDNNPLQFYSYVIASLQKVDKNMGKAALSMLQSPQPPPLESSLITLINSIAPDLHHMALVLDDYHLVDSAKIHESLAFLIDHLPAQMHIIMATRADPLLPLARLRARNQLIEIRAAELSFTKEEIEEFFNGKLKLGLSSDEIGMLASRTEGWISGLQLAAHSLRERSDKSVFIKEFKGDNRHVVDYLVEEVLNRQPAPIQNFLMQTSILSRLSAGLCEAITKQRNCQNLLDELERADLFIFPLDNGRNWFRYHQLFADLLRQRLLGQFQGDKVKELHRNAYEWHLRNGYREEAMEHALAAEDFDLVSDLLEVIAESVWDRDGLISLLRWLNALPDKVFSSRLNLLIIHARSLNMAGKQEEAEAKLRVAELLLESLRGETVEVPTLNSKHPGRLNKSEILGRIATIRAFISAYKGDLAGIKHHARMAIISLNKRDLMWRSVAATTLGFAHGWSGDGDMMSARFAFSEAIAVSEQGGNTYFYLFAKSCLAHIDGLQGRLKQAEESYRQLLRFAEDEDLCLTGLTASIISSLGLVLCEKNAIEEGTRLVREGLELAQRGYDMVTLASSRLNMARALFYRSDIDQALAQIQESENILSEYDIPPWITHAASALKAWMWLRRGQRNDVLRWVAERELDCDTVLNSRRESEYLVLVRFLVVQGEYEDARRWLDRLIPDAEAGMRVSSMIQMRLIRAQIYYAQNILPDALEELGLALYLGEPGNFVRTFVVEGKPIAELLEKICDKDKSVQDEGQKGFSHSYAKKLLSVFRTEAKSKKATCLDEPLSERECEVLSLIAAGLSNNDIAQKLFLSLNTVRTHTKSINAKLDVHSRTQAVARAKELGLL